MRLDDAGEGAAVFEVDVDADATDLELAAGGGVVARARVSLDRRSTRSSRRSHASPTPARTRS
ncbi:hypothetical protein [Streptomyces alboflavus]|nr:hypothetical protein [Streptomyces alboflavus]